MTVDGVREVLEVRSKQAALSGVHPHRFRHTFAHRWPAGGRQEWDLMMLAGWPSDDMLSRNTALDRGRATSTGCVLFGCDCRSRVGRHRARQVVRQ